MCDLKGRRIGGRHARPHAKSGWGEQTCGECEGHPDAAMGRWISWKASPVQRDTRPGEALHVGHVAILVQVRIVVRVLLENAEDAGGCLASFLATRNRCPLDPALGVVDFDPLAAQ